MKYIVRLIDKNGSIAERCGLKDLMKYEIYFKCRNENGEIEVWAKRK